MTKKTLFGSIANDHKSAERKKKKSLQREEIKQSLKEK
jgi:hypothetical protein